ncbi:NAD(P)-dependent oxidoreductase [Xanthomarina sp. F1114]|uniref:NAD-dependent epimerase/dehydratase family protein n=1 Tax=Xanthomarina sp. F1114 TaxID=2996019 RepID=UPI00225DED21|nr:NAD(P)-dependent oxidoreductase [Xanthomarina sp. F1114]MCX7548263.1 NAD(P)-dependent oxidoreductase [Xanthomarina sp. F1114]
MKKTHILLTGASGTVGFEVLKQLIKKGDYNISVFDKESKLSRKKLSPYNDQINLIYGDISNPSDLEEIINIDVVIHLAAIIPPLADEVPELAKKVNIQGTQNLIKQLETHSPEAFFLYSSSISVYGDRIENPYIQINDPLIPSEGDAYAETKIEAEKHLQNSKLDWTIFRLAAIMGGHKMSKLMFHQPLNTALEIATPRDTARAFVNAIEKQEELSKQIFNLGGGENCRISYEHFLERSFAIFGLGKLDFPEHAFADKNFHCGYYADGDKLEKIVNFRKDSLEDYFKMETSKISTVKKTAASIFRKPIKWYLLKQSEPLEAWQNNDKKLKEHFFNK